MFGTCFRVACRNTTKLRSTNQLLRSSANCAISTMGASTFDGFSTTATDVLRFRTFYSGHTAALYFALVPLSKASCDQLPSGR